MFMAQLKDVVKKRRKELRRTQREVAKDAGISSGYLGMIESGKVGIPSPGVMANLARVLDMPEEALLQAVGYLEGQDFTDDELQLVEGFLERILALPTESEQFAAYHALPARVRKLIRSLGALVLRAGDGG